MRIKLFNQYWDLKFTNITDYGICLPDLKLIKVRKSLEGEERLSTILHELLHAGDWPILEGVVDNISTNIAHIICMYWKYEPTSRRKNGNIEELAHLITHCFRLVKIHYESDEWADQFGEDCSKILWRLGYRKNETS